MLLRVARVLPALLLAFALAACARSTLRHDELPGAREVEGVGTGYFEHRVEALVVPPEGWTLDPPKITSRHTHLAWLSPTGDSAYGVILGHIPWWVPVALMSARTLHDKTLEQVMIHMRKDQGEAVLLGHRWDGRARKLSFEAEGGLYRIDSIITVRGYSAWIVYVGRLREHQPNEPELAVARKAREATRVGLEARELSPRATRRSDCN